MLSQAHRRSIHTSLTPVLGEEETDALMSEFPASESDMPVTKADLAEFRVEIHDLFRQMAMQILMVLAGSLVGGITVATAIAAGIVQALGG